VIIAVVSILMGLIGVRERTSFALTSRFAFGREGSRLPSLVMAVIIAAFYGYVLGITVDVFPRAGTAGQIAYSVALGLLFLLISGLGFERGLKWVGRFGVPVMIVLVLVAVIGTLTHVGGFGAIVDAHPKQAGGMTLAGIIGLGVAKWLAGATVPPDLLRFRRNTGTVITTVAEFSPFPSYASLTAATPLSRRKAPHHRDQGRSWFRRGQGPDQSAASSRTSAS
jgi:cytosine permease